MPYIVPPHLAQVPNPAETYAKGVALGQEVRLAEMRIAAEREQAAMQMTMRQQAINAESLRRQQELEITKAQTDIQASLRMKQLEQAQAKIDLETSKAARAYEAQAQYQRWVDSGGDKMEGLLRFGPAMGMSMAGMADVAKFSERPETKPASIQEFDVQGQKVPFLRVPRPTGDIFQRVNVPEKIGPGGAMQSFPIRDEAGNIRPGWFATQSPGGGMVAHKGSNEQIILAQREVSRLQRDFKVGKYFITGKRPPENVSQDTRDRYEALKPEYDQWKSILDTARKTTKGTAVVPRGTNEESYPALQYGVSVSGIEGPLFNIQGRDMIYIGESDSPLMDTDMNNWEEAEE